MGRSSESSKTMMRHNSHTSSTSNSNSTASPKGQLGFFKSFKKWPSNSASGPSLREDTGSNEKIFEPNHHSEKILSPTFQLPELEITRSNTAPSPDSFVGATHDAEFLQLRENIRRLKKAPGGPDPKKVDAVWEVYKKLREESLHLCTSLIQKAQNHGRDASLDSTNIGPLDTRSSFSGSLAESSLPFQVNDQWLKAINEYKSIQEAMLENLRTSLLTTYKAYEPEASVRHLELFLEDKLLRKSLIIKWRDASVHRMKSEKLLFWEQYKIRSLNFDRLKLDLQAIEKLFDVADAGEAPNMAIREYVIAKNGDTILEFANNLSEVHPILRFRVSSHLLAEASPLFSQIFSSQNPGSNPPLDMISQLPPPPSRHTCKDGMEVKVYRMPQVELNKEESLTILLHAAHMHKPKVPHDIDFPVFVNIAEVCLKYRCTAPLEIYVEYIWLPHWEKKIADENDDGLLLISYTFGIQGIFTRMSKTAILNAVDDEEIQSKEHWPQAVRDRIKHTRAAKIAQIRECCTNAIQEYFKTPSEAADRPYTVGSLQMTTIPRCPRGSHQCDATNLGWLMLVFNELRVLPSLMNATDFPHLPQAPKRSLKELVDCMRLMPSAPQVHSGICDYAPAFRSAINDIYNSVTGLTLRDVSGKDGWALSKHRVQAEDIFDIGGAIELPASLDIQEAQKATAISNEDVALRVLSHIDNLEDLNAAAMIDRTFYNAYKRNEAVLLKNIMKAERKRTMSFQTGNEKARENDKRRRSTTKTPSRLHVSTNSEPEGVKYLVHAATTTPPPPFDDSGGDDLYDSSPSFSPLSYGDVIMSDEEAHRILWGEEDTNPQPESSRANGQVVERNDKCLVGDVSHIEDKTRMVDDEKHLRDEKDKALGLGIHKK